MQHFENNLWQDLSEIKTVGNQILNADTTIKAFTVSKVDNIQENLSQEDGKEEPEKPKEEEVTMQNSNFDHATSRVKNVKFYTATTTKEEYATIEIEVNDVIRNSKQDDCEYYYYLAPTSEVKQDIEGWIKISEKQEDSNKLTFTIDIKEMESNIQNYQELSNIDMLYLYIKEVVKNEENEAVKVSSPMILEPDNETEIYIDQVKIDFSNLDKVENNQGNQEDKKNLNSSLSGSIKDDTVAKKILPNTGIKTILVFMVILVIVGLGVYKYIKYKVLSQYIK